MTCMPCRFQHLKELMSARSRPEWRRQRQCPNLLELLSSHPRGSLALQRLHSRSSAIPLSACLAAKLNTKSSGTESVAIKSKNGVSFSFCLRSVATRLLRWSIFCLLLSPLLSVSFNY